MPIESKGRGTWLLTLSRHLTADVLAVEFAALDDVLNAGALTDEESKEIFE